MSKKWEKYINKLPRDIRNMMSEVVYKIQKGELENLDIKPFEGSSNTYRCRTGMFRILFTVIDGKIKIIRIKGRGDIYKF